MLNDLLTKIVELEEENALALAKDMLAQGEEPTHILDCARQGLVKIGKLFEENVYFLPQLMMGGEIMTQIAEEVKPYLVADHNPQRIGTVVLGTVAGDLHDIGKNIVAFMLDIHGFEVLDLGIDVAPETFIEKIKEANAPLLGLSGFLHFAHQSMKATIDLLEQEGLRDQVKVVIGGGQVDQQVCDYTGADSWGSDAMDAVKLFKEEVVDHE